MLTGELYDGKSSDIWSMGVLLYAMLTGTYTDVRKPGTSASQCMLERMVRKANAVTPPCGFMYVYMHGM